jgi:rhodanese-related sulfurtransferase
VSGTAHKSALRIVGRVCSLILGMACALLIATTAVFAQDQVREAIIEYTDFATYDAGIILPAQITDDLMDDFTFIDTRTTEEFAEATIDGAIHIEWRDVFSRLDEIPMNRKTVLFCNTGALSAQAAFGLRVMGYDNILVLQGGFRDWTTER